MKFRFALITFAALLFSHGLAAQDKQLKDSAESKELNMQAYVQLLRSDLKATKRTLIKESMLLDDKQAEVFGLSTINTTSSRANLATRNAPSSSSTPQTFSP